MMNLANSASTYHSSTDYYFSSDKHFDELLPGVMRYHSHNHWSPLEVSFKAAKFLDADNENSHILDVGAGVGKFCAAAGFNAQCSITGIEQRPSLVEIGQNILDYFGIKNVTLKVENMTQTCFENYNAIYLFNPFYENINDYIPRIDDSIELSPALYRYYSDLLFKKLSRMEVGTRLATYYAVLSNIPPSYLLIESHFGNHLNFWVKHE